MSQLLSTREVAQYLGVNEKMVYSLISEKKLPASKVTGKWLFPRHLVDQWIEANTLNFPDSRPTSQTTPGLIIIAGSNDPLLDRTISYFNSRSPEFIAVFGNLGSMGGLQAMRRNLCHIASSHLIQDNESEYNFEFADRELSTMPAVVNFCRREQGILIGKGNPKQIKTIKDLGKKGIRVANRPLGTGTRLLFDRELKKAGIKGEKIDGYYDEYHRHLDVGLEVLGGRVDAAPAIRPVAALLGLDFIPIRWERYDLLVAKERFFDPGLQLFLSILHEPKFDEMARQLEGYDTAASGRMVFPHEPPQMPPQIKEEKDSSDSNVLIPKE